MRVYLYELCDDTGPIGVVAAFASRKLAEKYVQSSAITRGDYKWRIESYEIIEETPKEEKENE